MATCLIEYDNQLFPHEFLTESQNSKGQLTNTLPSTLGLSEVRKSHLSHGVCPSTTCVDWENSNVHASYTDEEILFLLLGQASRQDLHPGHS